MTPRFIPFEAMTDWLGEAVFVARGLVGALVVWVGWHIMPRATWEDNAAYLKRWVNAQPHTHDKPTRRTT